MKATNNHVQTKPEPELLPAMLQKMLIYDEGFRDTAYRDTEGFLTIGIGFCLDRIKMPMAVAKFWLNLIMKDIERQLQSREQLFRIYKKLDSIRKMAVLNMCYQMGVEGVAGFTNMWRYLEKQDYDNAAREAALSTWARQTPSRAKRIAAVIKTGTLNSYS